MKKTFILSLMAVSTFAANADLVAQWDFEGNVNEKSGIATSVQQGTPSYVDSLTANTVLPGGQVATSASLGLGIVLSQTNKDDNSTATWLSLGSTVYKETIVPSKDFTLSAYINFIDFTGNDVIAILGTGNKTGTGMAFGIRREDKGSYSITLTTKNKAHNTTGALTALTAETWHHVAVSYTTTGTQEAPNQGKATFYLDGVQVATEVVVWDWNAVTGGVGSAIGALGQEETYGYAGSMTLDHVQVFDAALSQADILSNAGLVAYTPPTPAIPEPATATLSLLALAALAARRRRK